MVAVKPKKTAAQKNLIKDLGLVNVAVSSAVLAATDDFLEALIVEYIDYRVRRNDNKPVWLKIDWILDKLPYISRSGMAKKLKKLETDGLIIVKRGKGRHYHKVWYGLSPDMRAAVRSKGPKVYYNLAMAREDLEASVVYATIISLLKVDEYAIKKVRGIKERVGGHLGKVGRDQLLLDYTKLAEGTGMPLRKIRRAVKWLIDNEKIVATKVFGNKKLVSLPDSVMVKPWDLEDYFAVELPSECYKHDGDDEDDLPTEYYEHQDEVGARKATDGSSK